MPEADPGSQRGKRDQLPRKWRRLNESDDWRIKEMEKRNVLKYKYVKFLELKKVNKRLKQCKNKLLEAKKAGKTEEAAALREELKQHLADHEYVTYYPRHLPYNSLFPPEDSEASQRRREKMRKLIRETMEREGHRPGDAAEEEKAADAEAAATASKQGKPGKKGKGRPEQGASEDAALADSRKGKRSKRKKGAPAEAEEAEEADGPEAPQASKKKRRRAEATDDAPEAEPEVAKKKKRRAEAAEETPAAKLEASPKARKGKRREAADAEAEAPPAPPEPAADKKKKKRKHAIK